MKNSINRLYRDSFFKYIFGNEKYKQNTLDLYNTLNGTHYTNPDDVEFITLEDVFFINMKNDVGFMICNEMVLWENQTEDNRNIPYRFFQYAAEEYKKLLVSRHLDPAKNVNLHLPGVVCIMFYSGSRYADGAVLKLSDVVEGKTSIEVSVMVYNIGERIDTLKECASAASYARIISEINRLRKEGTPREEAVNDVLKSVPKDDVLYTIIHQEYDAVVKMLGYEYTLEDFKQNSYEKGRVEGREEGIEEGELRKQTATIIRMLTMQYSLPQIIAISDADEETIRMIAKENGLTIHE